MNNAKRAIREFYLHNPWDSLEARLTFPFFYRKFVKWLGEIPEEPDEAKLKLFLKHFYSEREEYTLVIPLKERVIILWRNADEPNQVIICPKEMVKKGVADDEAVEWFWKNQDRVIFDDKFAELVRIVWNSK